MTTATDRLAEIEGRAAAASRYAEWHQVGLDSRTQALALRAVLALANQYADQPTDYDEDTEAEIAVGREIRTAITAALSVSESGK